MSCDENAVVVIKNREKKINLARHFVVARGVVKAYRIDRLKSSSSARSANCEST